MRTPCESKPFFRIAPITHQHLPGKTNTLARSYRHPSETNCPPPQTPKTTQILHDSDSKARDEVSDKILQKELAIPFEGNFLTTYIYTIPRITARDRTTLSLFFYWVLERRTPPSRSSPPNISANPTNKPEKASLASAWSAATRPIVISYPPGSTTPHPAARRLNTSGNRTNVFQLLHCFFSDL